MEQMEAEEVPDVSEKMDVAAVPFFTLHRVRMAEPPRGAALCWETDRPQCGSSDSPCSSVHSLRAGRCTLSREHPAALTTARGVQGEGSRATALTLLAVMLSLPVLTDQRSRGKCLCHCWRTAQAPRVC